MEAEKIFVSICPVSSAFFWRVSMLCLTGKADSIPPLLHLCVWPTTASLLCTPVRSRSVFIYVCRSESDEMENVHSGSFFSAFFLASFFRVLPAWHDGRCQSLRTFDELCQPSCPLAERNVLKLFFAWRFNSFLLLNLPVDSLIKSQTFIPRVVFSKCAPTPFRSHVQLAAISRQTLSTILDISPTSALASPAFLAFASGNTVLPDSVPLAHRYGGHQFGHWANQLGDGRAILLGEYVNSRKEHLELQLKGSGKTPYSRAGDGRAVIRSSVREFLASEAMFHLGVPTSRAASLTVSDDVAYRDQFYNGNMKTERTAVVLRIAPSWFRFGSLEILARSKEFAELKQLADFVIQHHFDGYITRKEYTDDDYIALYEIVVKQTADLMAWWQSVGFAHGVCNTDNFSILSVTIDYGPFGFLDAYNPDFIPNHSDDTGRYSYRNQPDVGHFNLDKLREAIIPLVKTWSSQRRLSFALSKYWDRFETSYLRRFSKKMGIFPHHPSARKLVSTFLGVLEDTKSDFSQSFRQLNSLKFDGERRRLPDSAWALQKAATHRNWNSVLDLYGSVVQDLKIPDEERIQMINATNPIYILRNWMAEQAMKAAERDDFEETKELLQLLENPFVENSYAEERGFSREAPVWAKQLKVSCSS